MKYHQFCSNKLNSKMINLAIYAFVIVAIGGQTNSVHSLHLTGVTVMPDHPRADIYSSFFHELIAEISELAEFSYNLRQMPDRTKHGGHVGETEPQGIIGEVYHGRADFVIADIEITPERKKFVEFTRPFMRSKLAALVVKSSPALTVDTLPHTYKVGGNSSEHATTTETGSVPTLRSVLQKSKRIVIGSSNVERHFRTSKNPHVYHLLPSAVSNFQAALNLLNESNDYALISDSARLQLIAASDCQYRVITANGGQSLSPNLAVATANTTGGDGLDYSIDFAIGLKINSPFMGQFETALRYLEESGRLDALIGQHWVNYCSRNKHNNDYDDIDEDSDDEDDAMKESRRLADAEFESNGSSSIHTIIITRLMPIAALVTIACLLSAPFSSHLISH